MTKKESAALCGKPTAKKTCPIFHQVYYVSKSRSVPFVAGLPRHEYSSGKKALMALLRLHHGWSCQFAQTLQDHFVGLQDGSPIKKGLSYNGSQKAINSVIV